MTPQEVRLFTLEQPQGLRVQRYLGVAVAHHEFVMNDPDRKGGLLSKLGVGGAKSDESRFEQAKSRAFLQLQQMTAQADGNAVLGVKLDYHMLGEGFGMCVASGTAARLEVEDGQ